MTLQELSDAIINTPIPVKKDRKGMWVIDKKRLDKEIKKIEKKVKKEMSEWKM